MDKILTFFGQKEVYGLLLVVGISLIAYRVFNVLVDKVIVKTKNAVDKKRKKTVTQLIKNVFKYGIIIIAVIILLDLYGINVRSLIASLGVASAVAALALQDSLKDIISGSSLIMDNYFMVGDYIKVDDFYGQVISMGLKCTKIMNVDGQVLTISNRNISKVINYSQKTASALIEIPIAYEVDSKDAEKMIDEVLKEIRKWPSVKPDLTAYVGVTNLADSSVNYGIRIYCSPGKIYDYKNAARKLIKNKCDEMNIKIPYNQLEVHNA